MEKIVDVLAFGAHADDVEIGMGGTISKFTSQGIRVGICDLTQAELSSNGNVTLRKKEAADSAKILGVEPRINLQFPDRGLHVDPDKIKEITKVIRMLKPKAVFLPYFEDRHPDHSACARLVEEGIFSAGVYKFDAGDFNYSHRVQRTYFYMINGFHKPSFYIDISQQMQTKIDCLKAYASQFTKAETSIDTPLTNNYIETVEARERLFGKEAGVDFAEGFINKQPIILFNDLLGDK